MIEASHFRKNIRDLLELLASDEQQLAYERDVPHIDITRELVSMWFDDQYHPGDHRLRASFSAEELAALDEFHRFYSSRASQLPASHGTVRTWLACPTWREIMSNAQRTARRIA
jgi:hypothetical protein